MLGFIVIRAFFMSVVFAHKKMPVSIQHRHRNNQCAMQYYKIKNLTNMERNAHRLTLHSPAREIMPEADNSNVDIAQY